MVALEEAFRKASSKFEISELNAYQKLAITKVFVKKEDVFVNLSTGSGKYIKLSRSCLTMFPMKAVILLLLSLRWLV